MIELAFLIFPHFENHRVQTATSPADRPVLLWQIRPPIQIVWTRKNLFGFFEADSTLWILFEPSTLPLYRNGSASVV